MFVSTAWAQTGAATGGDPLLTFAPLVLIFIVFYFLLIRPQQKKAKQHREMVQALRRGDKVVTGGGIIATVAKVVNESEVLLEIAEGVRVRHLRAQITDVLTKPVPAGEGSGTPPANENAGKGGGMLGKLFNK